MEEVLEIKDLTEDHQSGYEVVTTKQSIKLLIDNEQSCCENWGYFWCNDKPDDFIGAKVRGVSLTDTALNEAIMEKEEANSLYDGDIMFVNIDTDKGLLQFVAYNEHNGYYGHTASVTCTQLTHEETL